MNVHLSRVSGNAKTGPIPVSTSSQTTCPPNCAFKGNGCYAENFPMSMHWRAVTAGERGVAWAEFLDEVGRFRKGQLWRHNQAGDLAGLGNVIDAPALKQLVKANKGKRGFTYTHYPATPRNLKALRHANDNGFTINLSTDSLTEADALYGQGVPLVTIVPPGWRGLRSPAGHPVTVCPAQLMPDMSCDTCQLCQRSGRRAIVAFEAHGGRRKTIIKINQEKS
jgi:hypothetical protein